jgi:motility quorum-sensing regulator / GCU-specific mRNA interferase toxin
MEKRSAHYPLSVVKTLAEAGRVRSTYSALAGGAALGFDFGGIVSVVLALTPKDFYKSMTTHADHRIWQDVYRPSTSAGEIYLKLTVVQDLLIVSFKEQ